MTPGLPALLCHRYLTGLLPSLEWLPGYDRHHVNADLAAGLTVALVLIFRSMAYAHQGGSEKTCPLTTVRTIADTINAKGA